MDTTVPANVEVELQMPVAGEEGIVQARQLARDAAKRTGFGMVDQSRIATAVSELARNVVRYATGARGHLTINQLTSPSGAKGIEIIIADEGPGIDDISLAMREGFTTGAGLGMGLPGAQRLMDEMEIESAPGRGTTITIRKWLR